MPQVRDSGGEGSCVGFAVAAALEDQICKARAEDVTISPRYIYYYAREQGGFPTDCDTGAHVKDAVDMLLQKGAVAEQAWPYKAGEFAARPSEEVERAMHYRISQAQRIQSLDELRVALQEGWSVVGGLCLFPSAETEEVSGTGRIPMPDPDERMRNAVAVCFVGFDEAERLLKFRTPWGPTWGDHGYGYVSYDYAQRFLSDAWAVAMRSPGEKYVPPGSSPRISIAARIATTPELPFSTSRKYSISRPKLPLTSTYRQVGCNRIQGGSG
jgi:C1A family cysteine protease